MNRRQFIQTSVALSLLQDRKASGASEVPGTIRQVGGSVRAEGSSYVWEWSQENDRFRIVDKKGRLMATSILQPAVIVQAVSEKRAPQCTPGKLAGHAIKRDRFTATYEGVNNSGKVSITWRFGDDGFWLEPVVYEMSAPEDVVSLHYFAEAAGGVARPALEHNYLVFPGISESSALSPIIPASMRLNVTGWLGHGAISGQGMLQQWGLPAHYFCGFHRNSSLINVKGAMKEHLSDAFCCGLAELPNGDLFFEVASGLHSLIVSYRSDIWGHLRGPGRFRLGSRLYWAVGRNYHDAIRQYYLGLVRAGVVSKKTNSAQKNSVVVTPQFNTWGAQVASGKEWNRFDESSLESIYRGLQASGMKAGMFVIDAKWEGKFGHLLHSQERFPHFEEMLARIRSEGHRLGMWAAFLRCEEPGDLGLTTAHMLQGLDGDPLVTKEGTNRCYLFDVTQPEVERVLSQLAKQFVRRYNPDLVKFDFGYELPSLSAGRPKDMNWAGERLLHKGLDVVVKAMREENPNLVVMYNSLSPLFVDYFDLHSPDDLFLCAGDYGHEANRRFFFSSLLGEIGMPTYGSGGYDWDTMPSIWFDSAVIGTLGSLNSFSGDEAGSLSSPARVAKYNGLAQILRGSNTFTIEPVDADYFGPATGARSSSWARIEDGEVVLVALRHQRLDGGSGTGRFRDIVRSSTSVVVASKTKEGIDRTSKLGVVPYGNGELALQLAQMDATTAEVIEHHFGGGARRGTLNVRSGRLHLPLREFGDDGKPVEWIELTLKKL